MKKSNWNPGMKSSVTQVKNSVESLANVMGQVENRILGLKIK
jgi:hypothetical protein